jgi:hypothetical protein
MSSSKESFPTNPTEGDVHVSPLDKVTYVFEDNIWVPIINDTWTTFLTARAVMIDELHGEGKTFDEISKVLSTDPVQIRLIFERDRKNLLLKG